MKKRVYFTGGATRRYRGDEKYKDGIDSVQNASL